MKICTKKILTIILSAFLYITMFCGCFADNTNSQNNYSKFSDVSLSQELIEKIDNTVDPSQMVNLDEGVSEKMYNRALLSEGSQDRLANAMRKAQMGEKVTIGTIGGSITEGSSSTKYENCYAYGFNNWWVEKFPKAEINFINAGIGGTDSYFGVHRVDEHILSYNPDVVIVEFAVNDKDRILNKNSYDSLVRKILSAESMPAVILLFNTMQNGESMQDIHMEIGKAYNLPMISYHDAVYPEISAGTLNWNDIASDYVHPNDAGHNIIRQLITKYLDNLYGKLDSVTNTPSKFSDNALTKDYYKNALIYNASNITAASAVGFEVSGNTIFPKLKDNWVTESGGSLVFEDVECSSFGVFYLVTKDGIYGKYDVYVDGEKKAVLNGNVPDGWGTYGISKQIFLKDSKEKHTIEIKNSEGNEDKAFTVISLLIG